MVLVLQLVVHLEHLEHLEHRLEQQLRCQLEAVNDGESCGALLCQGLKRVSIALA